MGVSQKYCVFLGGGGLSEKDDCVFVFMLSALISGNYCIQLMVIDGSTHLILRGCGVLIEWQPVTGCSSALRMGFWNRV